MNLYISRREFVLAQIALYVAIALQVVTWLNSGDITYGLHPLIILSEATLALVLGVSARNPAMLTRTLYRTFSFLLLGLISVENISSIFMILRLLITNGGEVTGYDLLASAVAIFLTNIIVFALWYWEIDSPGLSGKVWSKNDKDFQFTQQDMPKDFPNWHPSFGDYLYLSLTNAISFSTNVTKPLTTQAKMLTGLQAFISVFIFWLIVARSVSILGQ